MLDPSRKNKNKKTQKLSLKFGSLLIGDLPRVAPHFGAPSLAENAGEDKDDAEEEGYEEVEEDVEWLLGWAHDGPRTREREGSEWPPDF